MQKEINNTFEPFHIPTTSPITPKEFSGLIDFFKKTCGENNKQKSSAFL